LDAKIRRGKRRSRPFTLLLMFGIEVRTASTTMVFPSKENYKKEAIWNMLF
jgi:hypothetical protein